MVSLKQRRRLSEDLQPLVIASYAYGKRLASQLLDIYGEPLHRSLRSRLRLIIIRDAGLALSAYLDQLVTLQPGNLPLVEACLDTANSRKINAIELGSGCGIVGICLAQSTPNCDVLLTDLPEAQEIAERNLARMKPARESKAEFQQLNWDEPLPESIDGRTFDIILIADCTYNPDSGPSLVHTLGRLMKNSPNAIVLLSMKVRHQSELVFFELMTEAGFVQDKCAKIPLPDAYNDSEEVLVYTFLHKTRQGDI